MTHGIPRRQGWRLVLLSLVAAAGVTLLARPVTAAGADDKKPKGPALQLKVNPSVAFSPARVTVTAELRGGGDADEELYCPKLEWDWGDGTISEYGQDCEPFDAAKSQITRRWINSHTFETAGNYRVMLRLKRGSKTIVGGNSNVQVKPGVRDLSDYPQP